MFGLEDKADEWEGTEDTSFQAALTLGNFGRSKNHFESTKVDISIILNTI